MEKTFLFLEVVSFGFEVEYEYLYFVMTTPLRDVS